MKNKSKHTDESATQSVAKCIFRIPTLEAPVQIGFTDQKVTAHAGLSAFAGFLHWHKLALLLRRVLPQGSSPNSYRAEDVALGYMAGILSGAKKLAQVAFLRRGPALGKLLGIEGISRQPTPSPFFCRFKRGWLNTVGFCGLWECGVGGGPA